MEEQLNPLAVTHLLQHTLRSLCSHDNSLWVYAVFWRILPRNYPPPKWDVHGGAYDRTRANRRNWILAWEDGFCNFAVSACDQQEYTDCEQMQQQQAKGLQPELFFKMSHDIYNYGEGLIGKVAADHSHKWVFKEPQDHEVNHVSSWSNPADSQPRTWEAQFQSGIKTIALISVREGVVQLGAMKKVVEDVSYVVLLRRKFSYLESIPGVLLPHPSLSAFPTGVDNTLLESWAAPPGPAPVLRIEVYDPYSQPVRIMPSMSSLEALLSKLPSVSVPPTPASDMPALMSNHGQQQQPILAAAKEEIEEYGQHEAAMDMGGGESSSSLPYYVNMAKSNKGF